LWAVGRGILLNETKAVGHVGYSLSSERKKSINITDVNWRVALAAIES
jgi:hypothetical protein